MSLAPEQVLTQALWAADVQDRLRKFLMIVRENKAVSITFATDLEAEEFHKLLLKTKGRVGK